MTTKQHTQTLTQENSPQSKRGKTGKKEKKKKRTISST